METTVYIDVLFFINFSMDFVTLWLCALLTSSPMRSGRMTASAAIGALFGTVFVIFSMPKALTVLLSATVSLVMAAVAFGISGGVTFIIKQSALIWICAAILGGVMTALLSIGDVAGGETVSGGGTLSAICALSVILAYLALRLLCRAKDKRSATVTAFWRGRSITFSALCDSGNLMRDPISGSPVIPVSEEILKGLLGEEITRGLLSLDSAALYKMGISLRIIPRRAENEAGLIGGFIPDRVTVRTGKGERDVRCVLSPRDCGARHFAGHGAALPTSLL